jgi:hypothetical protein
MNQTCQTTAALNPRTHYAYGTSVSVMSDLRHAFEYMTDVDTTTQALVEVDFYRRKQGKFGRPLVEKWCMITTLRLVSTYLLLQVH